MESPEKPKDQFRGSGLGFIKNILYIFNKTAQTHCFILEDISTNHNKQQLIFLEMILIINKDYKSLKKSYGLLTEKIFQD
jgi:hypothetical protein